MNLNFENPEPKPCFICSRLLSPQYLGDDELNWKSMQPSDGGEIKLIFSYGSGKFDPAIFKGIICDDCTEKSLERLQKC